MCRHADGLTTTMMSHLTIILFCAYAEAMTAVSDGEDYRIVINVNRTNYTLVEGVTWNLTSNFTSTPPEQHVDWVRFRVPLGDLGGRRSGGTREEPSLTITNIMRNDTGYFEMFVNNSRGILYGPVVNLTVWYPLCCTLNTATPIIANEEESFDIPVSIDAFPDPFHIDWLVDGIPVNRTTGRFVNGNLNNPSLGVRAIKRWNEGNYAMTSTNDAGSIVQEECECNIQIIVNYAPDMICHTVDAISIPEGNDIHLTASVDAKPSVSFLDWLRNDQPVDRTSGRFLGGNVTHPNLTIQSIQREDSGVYSMFSNNSVGSNTTCNVTVDVQFRPIIICQSDDKITVPEGSTAHLSAIVQANPLVSFLDWLKDGQPVDRSTGRFLGGNTTHPNLTILEIQSEDSGRYTIFSNNTIGSQSACNITVDVQYSPRLSCQSPSNISVEEFGQFTLNVSIQANPALSHVEWFKDEKELNRDSGRFQNGNVDIPSLTVVNVQKNDTGLYSINASNIIGAVKDCNISVDVHYKPNITCLSSDPIIVNETHDFTISVIVDANPSESFVDWIKDGAHIDRDSGRIENGNIHIPSLTVRNAQLNDSGTYSILVNNTVGSVSACHVNVSVQVQPTIECLSPDFIPVNEGWNVELTVKTRSNPPIAFLDWLKDDQPVNRSSGRFLGGNATHPNLTILSIQSDDSGQYTVFANNTVGATTACNLTIDVMYAPRISCLSQSNISVEEFSQFTLEVSIRSNPGLSQVEWFKNAKELDRDSGRFENGNVDIPSLTVINVQKNDSGLYTLNVSNSIDAVSACNISVDVRYTPNITCLIQNSIVVNETEEVVILVIVDANPLQSFVDWFKDNVPINRSSGRFENGDIAEPSLTIKNIQDVDAGTFIMFVNNTVGSVETCEVNVTVDVKPRIRHKQQNYTVCENASVTLDCQVFASPAIHSLIWTKGGQLLDTSSQRYDGGTTEVPSLTIKEAVTSDEDVYHCSAENIVGSTTSSDLILEVLTKPSIMNIVPEYTLTENTTSTINCSVVSDPRNAIVKWYKDGIRIQTASSRYSNGNIMNPSLTINRVVRDDAGTYVCASINDVGESESQAMQVHVRYSPSVTVKYNNYGFATGTSAVIWCEAEAVPAVTSLEWRLKDGTQVLPKSNCTDVSPSYKLCNITESDSGIYQCVATYEVRTTISRDITVSVRDECLINITSITLSDGITEYPFYNGRLEVEVDGVWGTVCGKDWTDRATQVVCGMFGYSFGTSGMYGAGAGPIHLGHVACNQQDTLLNDCGKSAISNCTHEQDIWLNCSFPLPTTPSVTGPTISVTTNAPSCPTATPVQCEPVWSSTPSTLNDAVTAQISQPPTDTDFRTATITVSVLLSISVVGNTAIALLYFLKR